VWNKIFIHQEDDLQLAVFLWNLDGDRFSLRVGTQSSAAKLSTNSRLFEAAERCSSILKAIKTGKEN
jgi:hypothetical protein